jgi:hypothetical protein
MPQKCHNFLTETPQPRHAPATSVVDKYFVQTKAQSRQKGCYEQGIDKEFL